MRYSRSLLVAAAAIVSVSLAGMAQAQGQARARRTPPAAPPGTPGGAPNAAAPNAPGPDARGERPRERRAGDRERLAGGGSPASGLLRLRNQLALTDDQVKRLEALQNANVPRRNPADELRARADLMDAMQGEGNLSAARAAMDRMNKVRTDRAVAQLKLRQDARAVLTADQKGKLDNMRAMRGDRQRMVAQGRGFGPGAGRGFAPGARGRDFGPGARMRQPMGRPQGPGMRQQFGPPNRGQMGPGIPPRMRRGGEELDSLSLNESRPDPRLGADMQLPPNG
ncbi:MAG TPA: Spy/CpxP family protein refolding chaperone [Gemmatimonas sp.]|uniref:Spy/CpxP family protein refolding chaperone n=1 Tax=Gemmatimonas sp. TaxID=1962908 RepID=UPI002EDA771B